MNAVASDRRALFRENLKAACFQHEALVWLTSEYLARSMSLQHDHQTQLASFFLGRRIAEKLAHGRLPLKRAAIVRGGPSNGVGDCDACDSPLYPRQLVMEVPTPQGAVVCLHADCFVAWDDVRRRL